MAQKKEEYSAKSQSCSSIGARKAAGERKLLCRKPRMPAKPAKGSILRRRATPSRQVIGVGALGQLQRLLDGTIEVARDLFALHVPTQEIRPEEFAERRRVLGEA